MEEKKKVKVFDPSKEELEQKLESAIISSFDHIRKKQSKGAYYPSQGAAYADLIMDLRNRFAFESQHAIWKGLKLKLREDLKKDLFEIIQSIGDVWYAKKLEKVGILPPEGIKIEAPECEPGIYLWNYNCHCDPKENYLGFFGIGKLIRIDGGDVGMLPGGYTPFYHDKSDFKKRWFRDKLSKGEEVSDEELDKAWNFFCLDRLIADAKTMLGVYTELGLRFDLPADKRIAYCIRQLDDAHYYHILGKAPDAIIKEIKERLPEYKERIK